MLMRTNLKNKVLGAGFMLNIGNLLDDVKHIEKYHGLTFQIGF